MSCVNELAQGGDFTLRAMGGTHYWFRVGVPTSHTGGEHYALRLDAIPCPSNDKCTSASNILALPYVDSGSIDHAMRDNNNTGATACSVVQPSSPILWYELRGTGSCLHVLLADDFDGALALYTGECGRLQCEDETSTAGELTWRSTNGTLYRIAVTSSDRFGNEQSGRYNLVVKDSDACADIPLNSRCSNAEPITAFPFETGNMNTELVNNVGSDGQALVCDNIVSATKALWYSINVTDDGCIFASTEESEITSVIAVYEGSSCSNLTCIGTNEEYRGYYSSGLFWKATPGATYYLLAGGRSFSSGSLRLSVDTEPCIGNDSCDNATEISVLPYVHAGSLRLASRSEIRLNSACPSTPQSVPSAWYTLQAPSSTCLTASVAVDDGVESNATYNIAVHLGSSCSNMTCVVETSTDNRLATWEAVDGLNYKIAVFSDSVTTDFVFTVAASECQDTPLNDMCSDAISIESFPFTAVGSNVKATSDDDDRAAMQCNTTMSTSENTLWYTIDGDGSCFKVTVEAEFPIAAHLFTGDCEDLQCLEPGGLNQISWRSEDEESYFIMVGSQSGAMGAFSLSVEVRMSILCNEGFGC